MPSSNDKTESLPRLTRSKLRLNSDSEANDLEIRSETPTRLLRGNKKIDVNDEPAVSTPTKRTTRASSATRTILDEQQAIASPLRRTTRRMSSERDFTASPLRTRSTRRSNQNLNESDDDSVIFVSEQQATPRTKAIRVKELVKLEEVVEEEPEVSTQLNTSTENELELRNRSIDRTPPCVVLTRSSPTKVNNPKSLQAEMDDAANNQEENDKNSADLTKETQAPNSNLEGILNDIEEIVDKSSDSHEKGDENVETIVTQTEKVIEYQLSEKTKDLIEGNEETTKEDDRSIEEMITSPQKTSATRYVSDFANFLVSMSPFKKSKNGTPDKASQNADNAENLTPKNSSQGSAEMDFEDSDSHSPNKKKKDTPIKKSSQDSPKHVSESPKQRVSINSPISIKAPSQQSPSKLNTPQKLSANEEFKQKSPQKLTSWSTSITRKSLESIDTIKATTDQAETISGSISTHKVISSDESESEKDESNSLVIDEADVADTYSEGDSMTKSEREEMEENMIEEDDGESLGSQNTDELDEEEQSENDSFIADEEIENEYSMDSNEEMLEEIAETPKRASRIIRPLSSDSEGEKEAEKSPTKNSQTENGENAVLDIEKLFKSSSKKKSRQTLPAQADVEVESKPSRKSMPAQTQVETALKSSRKSLPAEPTEDLTPNDDQKENIASDNDEEMQEETEPINNRKRKRISVAPEATPKRFKEMSPNESEALHMEEIEESTAGDEEVVKKSKKKKAQENITSNIPKLLDRCEEYLEQFNQTKKEKKALKRQNKEIKMQKKAAEKNDNESFDSNENKENTKKKKSKNKTKKQKLVGEMAGEKDDMAAKLSKLQEKLELKRERKKKKKELKAANMKATAMEIGDEVPNVEKKKKKKAIEPTTTTTADEKSVKKNKKRRIEDVNESHIGEDDVIEKPKAKKMLNILQQVEDPRQKPSTKNVVSEQENSDTMITIASKVKQVIPKGLDKGSKKLKKKKLRTNKIPEPKLSLPRPVWTSAGTFIEETIQPFKFSTTVYKPIKVAGAAEGRVIPFEAKSKKQQAMKIKLSSKEEALMNRNKKSRDKTMKNIKNLI